MTVLKCARPPGYIYIKEDAGTLNAPHHHFYQDLEKKKKVYVEHIWGKKRDFKIKARDKLTDLLNNRH